LSINGIDDNWIAYFTVVSNTPDFTTSLEAKDFNDIIQVKKYGKDLNYVQNETAPKVSTIRLSLDVDSTAWVSLVLVAPHDIGLEKERTVTVLGQSLGIEDDTSDNDVVINIQILRSNLLFAEDIRYPKNVDAGQLTTLKVKIVNNGEIDSHDVVILLKVDGEEVETKALNIVPLTQSKFVAFNWMAKSGEHDVEVVIDPDDTVVETNENDNVETASIKVGSDETVVKEIFSQSSVCASVLAILALAAIGCSLYLWRRFKQIK